VSLDTLRQSWEQAQAAADQASEATERQRAALKSAESSVAMAFDEHDVAAVDAQVLAARRRLTALGNSERRAHEQAAAAAAAVEAATEAEHKALVAARTLDWRRAVLDWLTLAEAQAAAEQAAKRAALALTSLRGGDESPRSWWVQEAIAERVRRIADFNAEPRSREQIAAWLGQELGVEATSLLGKKRP
jgi:hypothetical protein